MSHLRQAVRKLRQSPGFTILSVLTLAVGIAATTAIFSVVNAVLLRPLPFPDSERLVVPTHDMVDATAINQSDATYVRYREHNRVFEDIAIRSWTSAALTGMGDPERLRAMAVTASFFRVLRLGPVLGRAFEEAEERPGAPPVVILGDGLWRRRFGAEREILGRTIELDGVKREIIGVMPPGFDFPARRIEVWLPLEIDPVNTVLGRISFPCVARLRGGVSVEAAEADLNRLLADMEEAFPGDSTGPELARAGFTARVMPLRDVVVGEVEATLWILLGTVSLVLAIACANVANLFLVRSEGRLREVAVRTALGATRARLMTGSLTESVLLGVLAGLVGLLGAWGAIRLLVAFTPGHTPRLHEVGIDGRVVAFTAAVAILTGLLFGLIPALRARVGDLGAVLKEGGRRTSGGRGRYRARQLLVGAQVALALVLLLGSGLMVRSFLNLSGLDPGFRAAHVLSFQLSLPEARYPEGASTARFFQQLTERIETLPGVESVGATSSLPLGGHYHGRGHLVEDSLLEPDGVPPSFKTNFVAPGYFATLGIALKEGRPIERSDHENRRAVAVVSESLARRYWPDESALGKRLTVEEQGGGPWYTIVGVVGDVRSFRLTDEPPEAVYYSMLPTEGAEHGWTARDMTVVVRTQGEPTALVDSLRREVSALDPSLPMAYVETLEEVLWEAKAPMAFTVVMLVVAAAVSLLLGAVGTFGIISHLVSQRTQEIGVRMALGARRSEVVGMVLREGLVLAGAGAGVGLAGAVGLTRWLESILFQVSPLDPVTFFSVPVVLVAVAMLASWQPAQRASRVDPMVALRYE
ncbi:MAG: ABC transporter permease [bacterium]|nr:ABC transporter permease [bacterium]